MAAGLGTLCWTLSLPSTLGPASSGLALGPCSSARALCGGRLQKVPAVAFRHSQRVVVAEPMCGSQEEVRTYSPAHMMSDLVLGK